MKEECFKQMQIKSQKYQVSSEHTAKAPNYVGPALVFLSLSLGFLSLGFAIMTSGRSMYVPYLVTVDKQGSLIDHGLINPSFSLTANMKASFACDYIEKLYSVSKDKDLQYRFLTSVFAMTAVNSQALGFIEEYYTGNEVLSEKYPQRSVRIDSVASLSDNTFMVEFYVPSAKNGGQTALYGRFKSRVTIEHKDLNHDSLEELRLNPLGIFVTEITLSKIYEDNQ